MIIHYDRTPYVAKGKHGSRVQRSNHRRRREWERAKSLARSWPQFSAPLWFDLVQKLPPWMLDPNEASPMHALHYGLDGKPIGMMQASLLTNDYEARRIGDTRIGDDYRVSTVFMTDTAHYTRDGRPLLYESMVFYRGESVRKWVTSTRPLAEQQHEWVCHAVRQEAQGLCPHSGETFRDCKSTDLCDCFDYPEHEHYRHEGDGDGRTGP